MAQVGTSYADWVRNNRGTVDQAVARVAPAPAAPAPAPAATPAPVTIQVNAGGAQPAAAPPAAQMKQPEQPFEPAPAEPTPAPSVDPPVVEAVSMPGTKNLKSQQAGIQADRIADLNAVGQSHLREGAASAAGQANVAEAIGDANAEAKPLADSAQANAAANNEQSNKYKRYMDEDIEALRKPIIDDRNGWEKAGSILTGIVGAMFQGRGMVGNALSYGMNALESHINRNLEDQLNAKDSAGKSLPHVEKAMKTLAEDSNDQTEIASKLMANQYLMAENTLKKIGAETKVPEIKENAFRLAVGARDKANEYAEGIVLARMKAAAAGNGKKDWSQFPLATLEAWEASGQLPGAGVQYLDSVRSGKLKNQDAVSAIGARDAAAQKAAQEAAGGAQQEIFPGYVATIPLEKSTAAQLSMNQRARASVVADLKELKAIRLRNKGKTINDPEDVRIAGQIINGIGGKLSQMNGMGAPSKDEQTLMLENVVNPTDRYMVTEPTQVYDQLIDNFNRNFDSQMDAIGVVKKAAPQAPPPRAEEVVMVRAPESAGGGVRPVARSKLAMALQAGGTLVSEETRKPADAAMADASDADYEEQVRREQGY
jgi:hypothetical protein